MASPRDLVRWWWPRLLSLALGVWLVASSLAGPALESSAAFNRFGVGTAVVACSIMAIWAGWFRFANTAWGVWLFLSGLMFGRTDDFEFVFALVVAVAIVVLSLVPTPERLVDPRRPAEA